MLVHATAKPIVDDLLKGKIENVDNLLVPHDQIKNSPNIDTILTGR